MYVIYSPEGKWVHEVGVGIEWVGCACGATRYETRELARAVCEANAIPTSWVFSNLPGSA